MHPVLRGTAHIVMRMARTATQTPGVIIFDYLIIGAGSSGSVLAARLTEDPDTQVLLLEAGPAATPTLWQVP